MNFKRVLAWKSDDMPETTEAVVYVSSCGKVKIGSYKQWNKRNKSYSLIKERAPKVRFDLRGDTHEQPEWKSRYETVALRGVTYRVHRLVAMAWIPNPENKPFVNHKNGIRNDNRVENLEWVTPEENIRHAIEAGLSSVKGEDNPYSILTESQVVEIKEALKNPSRGIGVKLAKKYNVSPITISAIRSGRNWSHV